MNCKIIENLSHYSKNSDQNVKTGKEGEGKINITTALKLIFKFKLAVYLKQNIL